MLPWCSWRTQAGGDRLDYWLPDAQNREVVWTTDLRAGGSWTNRLPGGLPALRGTNSVPVPRDGPRRFYRIRLIP